MELIAYIRLFKKWWWLIAIAAFLAGGASYLFTSRQPDRYQAWVSISVGSFIDSPDVETNELWVGQELAQTYAVIAKYNRTLEAAVQMGNLPVTPAELGAALSTHIVPDTSLLVLTVTYTDPVLAADMANEVARQLILNSPTNLTVEQQSQIDMANTEITRLREELSQMRLQLSTVNSQLETTTDEAARKLLTEERNTLITQINQASSNIADFTATVASLQRRTNSLDIVQPAQIPNAPIGSNTLSRTILAAMVGAALAVGGVLLIEYLDNTIKTTDEVSQILEMPTLATIPRFGKKHDEYPQKLIAYLDPGAPASEQYRMLRTNLVFSSNGTACNSYVITSPGPSEGKSVVAANLAVTLATAGYRVLLVDTDLRRPRVHEIFNINNEHGLSTLLGTSPSRALEMPHRVDIGDLLGKCVYQTDIPGLQVIPSGASPLNPTEVLGSTVMKEWYAIFQEALEVDVVLFDSPPALVVADSTILAASLDAQVLAVFQAGQTRINAALRLKEVMQRLDVKLVGVVLNAVNWRDRDYYGYEYYYYRQ